MTVITKISEIYSLFLMTGQSEMVVISKEKGDIEGSFSVIKKKNVLKHFDNPFEEMAKEKFYEQLEVLEEEFSLSEWATLLDSSSLKEITVLEKRFDHKSNSLKYRKIVVERKIELLKKKAIAKTMLNDYWSKILIELSLPLSVYNARGEVMFQNQRMELEAEKTFQPVIAKAKKEIGRFLTTLKKTTERLDISLRDKEITSHLQSVEVEGGMIFLLRID